MRITKTGSGVLWKSIFIIISSGVILFFQNCSSRKFGFEAGTSLDSAVTPSSIQSCVLPWGKQIQEGETQIAFEAISVSATTECVSQERVCNNGQLSGSFAFESCTKITNSNDCISPWGSSVPNGGSVTAFASSSVAVGGACQSQLRACTNGVLSGTYSSQSCEVDYGIACLDYASDCAQVSSSCTEAQCVYSGCGLTSYVVPNGVSSLMVKMWGGGGSGNSAGDGGGGGFVKGTLAVIPGQVLEIGVAQSGCAGGGGGASFVRTKNSNSLFIVAGGGGGGGSDGNSGRNGNVYSGIGGCNDSVKASSAPNSASSYGYVYGQVDGGSSGSATVGGMGGNVLISSSEVQASIPTAGRNGGFMIGGASVAGTNPPSINVYLAAQFEVGGRGAGSNGGSGGGGAGYYGGGSGGGRYTYFGAGGGGGSCYFNGNQLLEKSPALGKNPQTHFDDPSLSYQPGLGGARFLLAPAAQVYEGTRGSNGAVIISF